MIVLGYRMCVSRDSGSSAWRFLAAQCCTSMPALQIGHEYGGSARPLMLFSLRYGMGNTSLRSVSTTVLALKCLCLSHVQYSMQAQRTLIWCTPKYRATIGMCTYLRQKVTSFRWSTKQSVNAACSSLAYTGHLLRLPLQATMPFQFWGEPALFARDACFVAPAAIESCMCWWSQQDLDIEILSIFSMRWAMYSVVQAGHVWIHVFASFCFQQKGFDR